MNLFFREWKFSLRSLVIWGIGIFLFVAASMVKYDGLTRDPSVLNIFYNLPTGLQKVFGVGKLDFSKASGFYGMIYPYLLLMGAIHASMLGAVILSKEERDRTCEFLYAKPLSRLGILLRKLGAALTLALALNLLAYGSSAWMLSLFGGGEDTRLILLKLMAGLALVQLVFLCLGIACAAMLSRPKAAAGLAAGIMLAAYLFSIVLTINGKLSSFTFLTPFSYFEAAPIVADGAGLSPGYAALCLILSLALLTGSALRLGTRDLKI